MCSAALGEQLPQRARLSCEPEVGREVPACEPDRRPCSADRRCDLGQRVGPVDVDVELVPGACGPSRRGPTAPWRRDRVVLSQPSQAAGVVRGDLALDPLAERRVDSSDQPAH